MEPAAYWTEANSLSKQILFSPESLLFDKLLYLLPFIKNSIHKQAMNMFWSGYTIYNFIWSMINSY